MQLFKKFVLGAVAASVLLALTAGTAAALRSIEVNEKSIHVRWRELSFTEPVFGLSVICPVTLRMVFNETRISKRATEIGNVTEVTVAEASCRNGRARALTERLPWVVLYNGFTGTLPTILTIRLILRRTAFLLEIFNGNCLYEGDAAGIVNIERGRVTNVEAEGGRSIPLFRTLSGSCAATGRFRGAGEPVRLRDLLGGITVTLV